MYKLNIMVEILLATYNGEEFLRDQIDSIINQTYTAWKLIIRDDGSTDNTVKIIEEYRRLYRDKIYLVQNYDVGKRGVVHNFSYLMKESTAQYIMLSDQDDIWLPEKIEKTLALVLKEEEQYGTNYPIMICSDLTVVDQELNIIHDSFWKLRKDFKRILNSYERLIAQSVVTGCTILINRAALDVSLPIRTSYFLHDQWLSIYVAYYGRIVFLDEKLTLYRQHNGNAMGAFEFSISYLIKKAYAIPSYMVFWFSLKKILPFRFSVFRIVWFKLWYNFFKFFK